MGDVFTGKITVGGAQVDCTYTVLSLPDGTDPGTVQVGDGSSAAIATGASGDLAIPATVDYDGGKYAVTTLGDDCFTGCWLLTDTGLATNSTVTSLGVLCFCGCTSLVNAALGSGLTFALDPFYGCTSLATVYFAGSSSSAEAILLRHGVDCYHLASDATWNGVTASQVSFNCTSLKALSQLAVSGGTYSGSPSNPWKSAVDKETLWAEGETVSVTASQPKTGYKVSGWTSSDAGGSFANATAQSTTYTFGPSADSGTTTLTAAATPISYKISFDANGGSGTMADEDMTYDVAKALTANAFTAPAAGYHFAGWSTQADGSGTAYADGASVENLTATDGGTFTLYAQWAEDGPVTISYASADAAMGSVSTASEQVAPATGAASGCTATASAGYHFVSWTNSVDDTTTVDATLTPAQVDAVAKKGGAYAATTFTAHFAEDADVSISYSAGTGGSVSPASEQVAPATGTASGCTATAKTGYHLVGWTDASGKEVSADATLVPAKVGGLNVAASYTANFARNAYKVAFDANGGSGTMADEDMAYGVAEALTASSLTRTNWSFAGWNTKADGTGTAYADGATVESLTTEAGATVTLFAQWRPARVQTRTYVIDGVEVTATLTGSGESIDGLVVERRDPSSAVTSALGDRVLQGDWDVYFTDGTTEGFGTLTLAFPAAGGTVQVWEVHSGALAKGGDQAVSGGTASATVTTLSEFAVTSAADAASAASTAAKASPRTGDGSGGALPALPLAAAGAALAALAAGRRRRADSRR